MKTKVFPIGAKVIDTFTKVTGTIASDIISYYPAPDVITLCQLVKLDSKYEGYIANGQNNIYMTVIPMACAGMNTNG